MSENDDRVEPGLYDEPQERLTRIAGALTQTLIDHPENTGDIKAAFMIHDETGGHGAALYGYPDGQETGIEALSDVVMHISLLFKTAGIEMELSPVAREDPDILLDGPEVPAEEATGKPKVTLTVIADSPDPRMADLCRATKEAIESTAGLDGTRLIMILDLSDATSAIMHHGYESHHQMAHGLFEAFQRVIAAEGGHVAVIPIMNSLS